MEMLQELNATKVNTQELDSLRKLVDRLAFDLESRPGFKDLEQQAGYQKDMVHDLEQ